MPRPAKEKLQTGESQPIGCAPNTLYPRAAAGGSWDDGASGVTEALPPNGFGGSLEKTGSANSRSVWYHTDAIFVGFRIVRPREIPTIEEVEKFWPSEGI